LTELGSLHDLINVPFHHKNIAQPGWACLARKLIKDAKWLLVRRLVRAGTLHMIANPRKHIPMSVPRGSEKIRPAGTVGTNNFWPFLASVTRLITPHLTYYIRKTTSRDHIGSLRFSALAGCHLHQTAGLSLPSRHGIRTRPRYPPSRQCFNTAIPWRLLGAFRTWCSTCEQQYRRELVDKQPLC
jgi:hypothetical protein